MIEWGSICSLKVNVIVSPISAVPWLPAAALPVEMLVAVGAVLSTVTV